jgi:cytochrome c-type biogenesis protein CcsB
VIWENVSLWIAVALYAAASIAAVIGVIFGKDRVLRAGLWLAMSGVAAEAVGYAFRWTRTGHGPYLGYYEVVGSLTLFVVATFVALAWRYRKLASLGVAVMPVAFLLLGTAMFSTKDIVPMSAKLASYWLVIHVIFSDFAFGCLMAAFALGAAYIVRERSHEDGPWHERLRRFPAQDVADELSLKLVSAGFLFWGIMIASGAIWANEAWGRYWGWDPIETWSLVVWLVYAAYLHLRLTLGWRGEKAAWIAIGAVPLAIFSLVGIPFVYHSIHTGYLAW